MMETMVLFSGSVFSFVWGLGMLAEREQNAGNRLLSCILFISGIWLLSGAYAAGEIHLRFPHFYLIHLPFVYFYGPVLYSYYSRILLEEEIPLSRMHFHYAVPFAVLFIILPFHFQSTEDKILFIRSAGVGQISQYHILIYAVNAGAKISILIYFTMILKKNMSAFSDLKNPSSLWKKYVLLIIFLLYGALVLGLLGFVLGRFFLVKISAMLLPFILFLFFILSRRHPETVSGLRQEFRRIRYGQSKIDSLNVEEIIQRLETLMKEEKAFSDEDLSLPSLSEELGISVHQLSQILNERLGKNFHQYINEHRIEEAKRMILDEPERTVLSVAYAVGFNSKSAFSKAFRTFTGITAQEYRKKYSVRK